MPCVRNLVSEFFGKEVKLEVDPDMAVAYGASIKAGMEKEFKINRNSNNSQNGLLFTDVCPMGIGINVILRDEFDEQMYYKSLIKPNTLIPYNKEYLFSLLTPSQDAVHFNVFQTHLTDESVLLEQGLSRKLIEGIGMSGTINDIPPSETDEPHPVKILFGYDINGMITLHVEITGTDKITNIEFNHSKYRMDAEDIAEARRKNKELFENSDNSLIKNEDIEIDVLKEEEESIISNWEYHPRAKQYIPLFNRAEKMISEHPEYEVRLVETINGLKKALANDDKISIDKFADDLTDLIFDIMD